MLSGVGTLGVGSRFAQSSEAALVLLDEGFESYERESFPTPWIQRGNDTQFVVQDDNAVGGSNILYMSGKSGGCREATADRALRLDGVTKATISLHVFPSTEGEVGCHDHRGLVALWTDTDPMDGTILASFRPDGTLTGHGVDLGKYELNTWHKLDIVYERGESEIRVDYRLDGESRGSTSWSRPAFESDLTYLRLASGDVSVWWDEIRVVQMAGQEPTRATTAQSGDQDDGDWATGLGLSLVFGLGYLLYRRLGSDNETQMYNPGDK